MWLSVAKDDIGQFIEFKHPEWELKAFGIDDLGQPGEMGRVFIVRVKDDDAELRPRGQRLLQQQAHRSGLADAGRSQNSKVPPHQFADVNLRGDIFVLAQPADLDALPAAKSVNGSEIIRADSVRRRAKGRERPNAAMKKRRSVRTVDNFAVQLDRNAGGVGLVFGPPAIVGRNFANSAHQTRSSAYDGDEMPYRPILLGRLQRTADNALRAV